MKIGSLELDHPLALAPMEDVSERPFRLVCKEFGVDLLYTEFVHCEALIRNVKKAFEKTLVTDEERPIAVQLYGQVEQSLEEAARVIERARPDFIDINCGCWVKKIALRGEGAGLLRDLKKFESVVKAVIRAATLPVTVKTRLGWDEQNIVILDVARMLEQAGVQALTVHCRTRKQGYQGQADWSWLEKIKAAVTLPIIGNGDVATPEDARQMRDTGVDGIMIGRGAINNPWIFKQIKHYFATGEHLPGPSPEERVEVCLRHLRQAVEYRGKHGLFAFRKHYSGYLKGLRNIARLRASLMQLEEVAEIEACLRQFLNQVPSTI